MTKNLAQKGIDIVIKYETANGRFPTDVQSNRKYSGMDIISVDLKKKKILD